MNQNMENIIFSNSILRNCIQEGNYAYLHLPMYYCTRNYLTLQMYADSIRLFIKNIGLEHTIFIETIDDIVLKFLTSDFACICTTMMNLFNDKNYFERACQKLDKIYIELPEKMKILEENIKYNNTIDFANFKTLYDDFVFVLSINNMNAIVEGFLSDILNRLKDKEGSLNYISQNTFSHIKYFMKEKAIFEKSSDFEQKRKFIWNSSFLDDKSTDGSIYDNYQEIQIKNKIDIIPEKFEYPLIKNDTYNNKEDYPVFILWTKLLQVNTEFRHYWQFRFMRNIRFFYNYDKRIINEWNFNDYKENLEKIK